MAMDESTPTAPTQSGCEALAEPFSVIGAAGNVMAGTATGATAGLAEGGPFGAVVGGVAGLAATAPHYAELRDAISAHWGPTVCEPLQDLRDAWHAPSPFDVPLPDYLPPPPAPVHVTPDLAINGIAPSVIEYSALSSDVSVGAASNTWDTSTHYSPPSMDNSGSSYVTSDSGSSGGSSSSSDSGASAS